MRVNGGTGEGGKASTQNSVSYGDGPCARMVDQMTCHGHRTCTCESLMPCMALSVNGTRGKTTDWDDVQWEMGMVMGFVGPWPCGCA